MELDTGPAIDKNLYWTGIVFFVGAFLLHVPWLQALVLALAAMICWYLCYSRAVLAAIGVMTFFLGLGVWSGLADSVTMLVMR
jgi:apolipoprotein N-acyltransferase